MTSKTNSSNVAGIQKGTMLPSLHVIHRVASVQPHGRQQIDEQLVCHQTDNVQSSW